MTNPMLISDYKATVRRAAHYDKLQQQLQVAKRALGAARVLADELKSELKDGVGGVVDLTNAESAVELIAVKLILADADAGKIDPIVQE